MESGSRPVLYLTVARSNRSSDAGQLTEVPIYVQAFDRSVSHGPFTRSTGTLLGSGAYQPLRSTSPLAPWLDELFICCSPLQFLRADSNDLAQMRCDVEEMSSIFFSLTISRIKRFITVEFQCPASQFICESRHSSNFVPELTAAVICRGLSLRLWGVKSRECSIRDGTGPSVNRKSLAVVWTLWRVECFQRRRSRSYGNVNVFMESSELLELSCNLGLTGPSRSLRSRANSLT